MDAGHVDSTTVPLDDIAPEHQLNAVFYRLAKALGYVPEVVDGEPTIEADSLEAIISDAEGTIAFARAQQP